MLNWEKVSKKYANFLVKNGAPKNMQEVYAYGMESFLIYFSIYGTIFICGLVMQLWIEALMWMVAWTILRNCIGGSHGKTHLHCFIVSSVIGIISLVFSKIFFVTSFGYIVVIGIIFSTIIVFRIAPVEHQVKKISNIHIKMRTKRNARLCIALFSLIVAILFIFTNSIYPYILTLAMVGVTLMALMGYSTNQKKL